MVRVEFIPAARRVFSTKSTPSVSNAEKKQPPHEKQSSQLKDGVKLQRSAILAIFLSFLYSLFAECKTIHIVYDLHHAKNETAS